MHAVCPFGRARVATGAPPGSLRTGGRGLAGSRGTAGGGYVDTDAAPVPWWARDGGAHECSHAFDGPTGPIRKRTTCDQPAPRRAPPDPFEDAAGVPAGGSA